MGYQIKNTEEAEMSTNNPITQLINTHGDDAFRFVLPFKVREQHKEWFHFYGRINNERDTYIMWGAEDMQHHYEGCTRTLTPELVAEEAFLDELYREVGNFEYGDKAEMSRHIWKGDPACDAVRNELNRLLRFVEKLNNTYKEKGEHKKAKLLYSKVEHEPVFHKTSIGRNPSLCKMKKHKRRMYKKYRGQGR